MNPNQHYHASSVVREWARKIRPVANLFNVDTLWDGPKFRLALPENPFYTVQVSFYTVKDHPEWMRVQSTNWRCEDEPNDVVSIEQAREMYRALLGAGLQAF